jgi:hypothetical protein
MAIKTSAGFFQLLPDWRRDLNITHRNMGRFFFLISKDKFIFSNFFSRINRGLFIFENNFFNGGKTANRARENSCKYNKKERYEKRE